MIYYWLDFSRIYALFSSIKVILWRLSVAVGRSADAEQTARWVSASPRCSGYARSCGGLSIRSAPIGSLGATRGGASRCSSSRGGCSRMQSILWCDKAYFEQYRIGHPFTYIDNSPSRLPESRGVVTLTLTIMPGFRLLRETTLNELFAEHSTLSISNI